jgi:glucose dehydrogenase
MHGGGPAWHAPAVDTAMGLLFVNVGNAAPDLDGSVRPGDNLYTCSIVALELATGKLKWFFQEVAHDRWDYDAASPVVLVDVPDSSGKVVHAVAEAGKTGWVYVLDRATGKPIRRSDAFAPQENMWTAPTEQGVLINPATLGGSDWSPPSFSPRTGYLYVNGNYYPQLYKLKHEELQAPAQYWGGTVVSPPPGRDYSLFSAVDLKTGHIAWQKRFDRADISGSMVTAGDVVFTGDAQKHFTAFDARSGAQLWQYDASAGVNAPPVSYAVKGVQYVAVAAGGNMPLNSPRGDEVLVFNLPADAR